MHAPGDLNPAVLYDAGFRIAGLEMPAVSTAGRVVIDVLLVHPPMSHLVVCRSKSGADVGLLESVTVRLVGPAGGPRADPIRVVDQLSA